MGRRVLDLQLGCSDKVESDAMFTNGRTTGTLQSSSPGWFVRQIAVSQLQGKTWWSGPDHPLTHVAINHQEIQRLHTSLDIKTRVQ